MVYIRNLLLKSMLDCFDYAHPNNCSHFENSKMPKCGGQSLKRWVQGWGEQIRSSVVFPVYKQGKIVAPGMGQLQCINHSTRVLKSPPIHIHYSMSMSATKTQNCTSNGIWHYPETLFYRNHQDLCFDVSINEPCICISG